MEFFTIAKQTTPLCFMPDGRLVCYNCGDIVLLDERKEVMRLPVFTSLKERFVARNRFMNRFFRLGIRACECIDDFNIILSIGSNLYEFNVETGVLSDGYNCGAGIRPLIFTLVNGIDGFKNGIYFGGYMGNDGKKPVNIYRRKGKDIWEIVYTFSEGTINHVHNIVADPYRKCLWVFTGDFDNASAIWKISDGFGRVECVACGNQKYRGCVVYVQPEGLLYATDAPFADNYIYLMDTDKMSVRELFPIDGSCIYGCQWRDKLVFSSTVEGDGRNMSRWEWLFTRKRGAGIKDNSVHMYMGNMQEGFNEIYKEEKDCMPFYTFQFGVFKFPYGIDNSKLLYFMPLATKRHDLTLMGGYI